MRIVMVTVEIGHLQHLVRGYFQGVSVRGTRLYRVMIYCTVYAVTI